MSEQDLIDLGFEKIEQNDEYDKFHYYSYDIKGEPGAGSLISSANDELLINDMWEVYAWDINESLVFDDKEDIKIYIDVLERNIK
jgi:hypothetical protein|tara:strand:- start:107 stop:361 length:255 start_codon:yes stop_codon:yes gene_type:complete